MSEDILCLEFETIEKTKLAKKNAEIAKLTTDRDNLRGLLVRALRAGMFESCQFSGTGGSDPMPCCDWSIWCDEAAKALGITLPYATDEKFEETVK